LMTQGECVVASEMIFADLSYGGSSKRDSSRRKAFT
jgi:hypothetical protein